MFLLISPSPSLPDELSPFFHQQFSSTRMCTDLGPLAPPTTAPTFLDNYKCLFIFLSCFLDYKDTLPDFSLDFFLQGCLWQKEKFFTKWESRDSVRVSPKAMFLAHRRLQFKPLKKYHYYDCKNLFLD